MNRAQYMALRAALRKTRYQLASLIRHDEMADSRLVVQMDSHAEEVMRLRARIHGIRCAMPQPRDPLGFAAMYRQWDNALLVALKKIRDRRNYDGLACFRVKRQERKIQARYEALVRAA